MINIFKCYRCPVCKQVIANDKHQCSPPDPINHEFIEEAKHPWWWNRLGQYPPQFSFWMDSPLQKEDEDDE